LLKLTTCSTLLDDLIRCVEGLCDLSESLQIVISLHTKQGLAARVKEFMNARKLASSSTELPAPAVKTAQEAEIKLAIYPEPVVKIWDPAIFEVPTLLAGESLEDEDAESVESLEDSTVPTRDQPASNYPPLEAISQITPKSLAIISSSIPAYVPRRIIGATTIRLLVLSPGRPDERVRVSIQEATLQSGVFVWSDDITKHATSPSLATTAEPAIQPTRGITYNAVSYTWTRGKQAMPVLVAQGNGQYEARVDQDQFQLLKNLRRLDRPRILWLDALCVNLTDLVDRDQRIPLIGKIFSLARKTYIWLGEKTEDAEPAFHFVKEIAQKMDVIRILDKPGVERALSSFSQLLQRRFFSRRWVVPEIVSAGGAELRWGNLRLSWEEFSTAIALFVEVEKRTGKASKIMLRHTFMWDWFENVERSGAAVLVDLVSQSWRSSAAANDWKAPSAEHLVSVLTPFKTQSSHDVIYASLAIARDATPTSSIGVTKPRELLDSQFRPTKGMWRSIQAWMEIYSSVCEKRSPTSLLVDYDMPYRDVCAAFVEMVIRKTTDRRRALDILCRPWAEEAPRAWDQLPSWICTAKSAAFEYTDARQCLGIRRQNGDSLVSLQELTPRYAACGDLPMNENMLQVKSGRRSHSLFVTGSVVDVIGEVEEASTNGSIPEEWLALAGWKNSTDLPPDAFWRTIVGDRDINGRLPLPYYRLTCRAARQMSPDAARIATDLILNDTVHSRSAVGGFCRRVRDVVFNRCLVKTEEGARLGLVSARGIQSRPSYDRRIREGDLICILEGCSVPVVLRRVEKTLDDKVTEYEDERLQYTGQRTRWWLDRARISLAMKSGAPTAVRAIPRRATKRWPPATPAETRMTKGSDGEIQKMTRHLAGNEAIEADPGSYYEFWGECYIHGIMDGEALALRSKRGLQTRVFELR
jgi:hypothetical protein